MFVFNVTATTETYTDGHTLSLHDALPISAVAVAASAVRPFCLRGRSLLRSPFASAAVLSLPRVCCFFCCLPLLLLLLPLPLLLLCCVLSSSERSSSSITNPPSSTCAPGPFTVAVAAAAGDGDAVDAAAARRF